jgi:hypothetical protein
MYNGFLQSFQLEEAISDGKTFLLRGSTDKTQQEPVITPNIHQIPKNIIIWLCVCTRSSCTCVPLTSACSTCQREKV